MKGNFYSEVYSVVKRIPKGKVTTYGEIARALGNVRKSRAVGYALHVNPLPGIIPCHRVVNRYGEVSGAFAFGGPEEQRAKLEAEGIVFGADGRIDLKNFIWFPEFVDNSL